MTRYQQNTAAIAAQIFAPDPPRIHATTRQIRQWLRAAGINPRILTGGSRLHVITRQEQITISPCQHAAGCHVIGELDQDAIRGRR